MLLFCDSFDHYATAQTTLKWTTASAHTIGAVGRNGTNGIALNAAIGNNAWCAKSVGSNYTTLVVGFAWKAANVAVASLIASFYDASQIQVTLETTAAGVLRVTRAGTTLLGTGTTALNPNTLYFIEIKVTFATGATGSFEVRINGTTEITGTLVQTAVTNAYANIVYLLRTGGAGEADYDDFYICDTSGAQNNDFLGDIRVQAVLPSGAGTTTQWTASAGANYTDVDEATPNDDTDYVSSLTVGQIDTYAMGDLAPTSGSIKGVQTLHYARKDDAGTRTIAPVFHIGATDYVQSNLPNLSTTYQYLPQVTELSPASGTAWTITEVNGMELGQKVIA